jgi:hypothetical protein
VVGDQQGRIFFNAERFGGGKMEFIGESLERNLTN